MATDGTAEDITSAGGGWRIRLPICREMVRVEKRTVVFEEVEIRREMIEGFTTIQDTVGREERDVRLHGDARVANSDR